MRWASSSVGLELLFADTLGDGIEAGAGAAGENDAFHVYLAYLLSWLIA